MCAYICKNKALKLNVDRNRSQQKSSNLTNLCLCHSYKYNYLFRNKCQKAILLYSFNFLNMSERSC